jgi:hypothetical protein
MNVRFVNQQDERDFMNRTLIAESEQLSELLDKRRKNAPFIADLFGDNGFQLTIGIGSGIGFAQYRRENGELPYLVAVPAQRRVKSRHVEFLINNTPTPIPRRFILTFDEMKQVALHFLETGEPSDVVSWEAI